MSFAPGLTESYPILTLPRISDLNLGDKVVIPSITSPDSSIIDLGISKSIIASYIIRPTPKLLWSFAISPTSVVNCMDVFEVLGSHKVYIVSITDRKSNKILVINKKDDNSNENYELAVNKKVIDLKVYQNGEKIVVIYENGSIALIDNVDNKLALNDAKLVSNDTKVLFNEFVSFNNDSLVIQVSINGSKLHYKLISLTNFKFFEITSKVVNHDKKSIKELIFAYNSQFIYQLNPVGKTVEKINILNFTIDKSISIESLITEKLTGLSALSPDRLLLSNGSKIHLINFQFSSLLSTYESKSSSSYPTPDEVLIKTSVPIKGLSLNTSNTFAIYLNLKPKNNNVHVNIINVNVGVNKLSECLGKAINKPATKFQGVVNLIEPDFVKKTKEFGKELKQVFENLQKAVIEKDITTWERILVPYMKHESWESIKKSINKKNKKEKTYTFEKHDIDNDRVINLEFIKQVIGLTFEITPEKQVKFINSEFIPEYTLIYLLTSPIFPIEYSFGLLELFSQENQETLLRQAIITYPFLNVDELLLQLVNPGLNDEIFEDVINRLCVEFSAGVITKQFKQFINSSNLINLDDLLVKLFKLPNNNNNAIYLIEILIDVGGLFNLSMNTIDTLSEFIEYKISAIMENSYNLTLANQALSKKKKKVGNDKLSSILLINDFNSSTIEISNKIPNYSIEKLII